MELKKGKVTMPELKESSHIRVSLELRLGVTEVHKDPAVFLTAWGSSGFSVGPVIQRA